MNHFAMIDSDSFPGRIRCYNCTYGSPTEDSTVNCLNPEEMGSEIVTCEGYQICHKSVAQIFVNSYIEQQDNYMLVMTRGCTAINEDLKANCGLVELSHENMEAVQNLVFPEKWELAKMTTCLCGSNLCNNEPGLSALKFDPQVEIAQPQDGAGGGIKPYALLVFFVHEFLNSVWYCLFQF